MQIGSRVSARGGGGVGRNCVSVAVQRVCTCLRATQKILCVLVCVCEPVDKHVLLLSISLSPAAALSGGGERPQKQLCFMAKAYRTIKTEAVCCTAPCVAD